MTIETRHTTAEELLRMPDDGFRYELVGGELRKIAPAGNKHGYVTMNLSGPLHRHVKANKLGQVYAAETGFLLARDPDTVRAPDAAFVRQARLDETGEVEGYWPGVPDLAFEVISPSDTHTEVVEKALAWRTRPTTTPARAAPSSASAPTPGVPPDLPGPARGAPRDPRSERRAVSENDPPKTVRTPERRALPREPSPPPGQRRHDHLVDIPGHADRPAALPP